MDCPKGRCQMRRTVSDSVKGSGRDEAELQEGGARNEAKGRKNGISQEGGIIAKENEKEYEVIHVFLFFFFFFFEAVIHSLKGNKCSGNKHPTQCRSKLALVYPLYH